MRYGDITKNKLIIVALLARGCIALGIKVNGFYTALFLMLALFFSSVAQSETYELYLTRKGSNVYKVSGKNIVIRTKYCYTYAYSEESIYKSNGYGGGDVIFLNAGNKCQVDAVYAEAKQPAGKYVVTVSREDDDWYSVYGSDTYIQTSTCLSLALVEEAFLSVDSYGLGRLKLRGVPDCMVEGIYSKIRI